MPLLRLQVTLKEQPNYPGTSPTNTFWAVSTTLLPAAEDFSDSVTARYSSLSSWYPEGIMQTGHTAKVYDMEDPEPRVPVWEDEWSFSTAPSGDALPSQVGLCMSFQGVRVSGANQRRRRGRVYFGPFDVSACGNDGRPVGGLRTALQTFGAGLISDGVASDDWRWHVYSRVNEASVPVVSGWVDNSFDIQRRRKLDPTSRLTFAEAP